MIAQELEPILPDFITRSDNEELKDGLMVAYTDFGILSIKAIQEEHKYAENLERKILDIEKINKQQKEEIKVLKEKIDLISKYIKYKN